MNVLNPEIEKENIEAYTPSDLELIFKKNHGSLVKKASSIVGNANAEDVVQEVWIAFYKVSRAGGSISSVSSWLNKVVFNKSLNLLKKQKHAIFVNCTNYELLVSLEYVSLDETEGSLLMFERIQQLEKDWSLLSYNQKKACELKYIDGLSNKEISKRLNISEVNSKVILSRAKKLLL